MTAWAIALLGAFLCVAAAGPSPYPSYPLHRYSVNVEDPPQERYRSVLQDYLSKHGNQAFRDTYLAWYNWIATDQPEIFGTAAKVKETTTSWFSAVQSDHPDFAAEVKTLSELLLATNTSEPLFQPAMLATVTSIYQIVNTAAKNTTDTIPSACTSILVRQKNGKVLHGRSLDFEPRGPLAQTSIVLDYTLKGRVAFTCLFTLPTPTAVSASTCVRPGGFSLSLNARSQGRDTEHNTSFPEFLRRVQRGALFFGEVGFSAMLAETYEGALATLASSPVLSSNYFILAGSNGQGSIVTRYGNSSSSDIWAVGSSVEVDDGQPPWMRVQTNVDHWVTLQSGAYATQRRQHAIDLLTKLGQDQLNKESLFNIYMTNSARPGAENRTTPEDTGAILRPTTIASVIMDPSADEPDLRYWKFWSVDPKIQPPRAPTHPASEAIILS